MPGAVALQPSRPVVPVTLTQTNDGHDVVSTIFANYDNRIQQAEVKRIPVSFPEPESEMLSINKGKKKSKDTNIKDNHNTGVAAKKPISDQDMSDQLIPADQNEGSREHLTSLIPFLESYPADNDFHKCLAFNPHDPSIQAYILPSNLQTFLQGLLDSINKLTYPCDLAQRLHPYMLYDTQLGRYRTHDNNLTLQILQQLDHLSNHYSISPSPLQKLKNMIRSRSSSKSPNRPKN